MSPLVDDLALPLPETEAERRRLLGAIGAAALATAGAGTVITAVRFLEPNVFYEPEARLVVGRPEDIPVGTVLVYPRLRTYVVRTPEGFFALSSVCTHLGCMTRYEAALGGFLCPCHGSRFAHTGRVVAGPAPRPLPRVALAIEDGLLVVDAKQPVASDFILKVTA